MVQGTFFCLLPQAFDSPRHHPFYSCSFSCTLQPNDPRARNPSNREKANLPHQLLHSGVPASSLHATDLLPGLISAGHALFRDAASTAPLFFAADFLNASDDTPPARLAASIDVVHASMFLHCFDLPTQHRALARVVGLLKPRAGSTVVGRQGGVARGAGPREEAVRGPMGELGGVRRTNYLHDEGSFREMWTAVGETTGSKWSVHVETEEVEEGDRGRLYFGAGEHRWLRFEVVRVE